MTNSPDQPLSRLARLAFLTLAGVALPLAPGMAQDEVRATDNQREAKLRAQVDAAAKEVAALRDELQALRAELQANRGPAAAVPSKTRRNPLTLAESVRAETLDTNAAETREVTERALAHAHEVAKKAIDNVRPHLRAAQVDGAAVAEHMAKVREELATVRPHLRAAQADGAAVAEHVAKARDEVAVTTRKAIDMAHAHADHADQVARDALAQAHEAARQAHAHAAHSQARAAEELARVKAHRDADLGAASADSRPARTRREDVIEELRTDPARASSRRDESDDRDAEIEALRRQMQAMQRKLEALQRATEARGKSESSGAFSSGGR